MRRALTWTLFAVSAAWSGALLAAPLDLPWLSLPVYLAGGVVCHQDPLRSFHLQGHQLPVCARCTGLYLAAPFGLLALLFWRSRAAARGARVATAAPPTLTPTPAPAPASAPTSTSIPTSTSTPTSTATPKSAATPASSGTPVGEAPPRPGSAPPLPPPAPTRPLPAVGEAVRWWRGALVIAAVPTALSVLIEWAGGPTTAVSRCLAALPLGATGGALLAAAALGLDAGRDRARLLHLPSRTAARPRGMDPDE